LLSERWREGKQRGQNEGRKGAKERKFEMKEGLT
jgi:hypothetical protein